jgi:hypothetical protein
MGSANPTVTTLYSAIGTITCARSATGRYTISWTTAFASSTSFHASYQAEGSAAESYLSGFIPNGARTTTSIGLRVARAATEADIDPDAVCVFIWGDLP